MKPITIIGGGIAGLSLGIALRRFDVPVTVQEAGRYPRHRVCGEFLSGVSERTLETLGISETLRGSVINRTTGWYRRNRLIFRRELPKPSHGLSRLRLDFRLADCFENNGGLLRTGTRVGVRELAEATEGTVHAVGKTSGKSHWLGLKIHLRSVPGLEEDLQMHLGAKAYAGICRIEEDRYNLCALFRRRPGLKGHGLQLICDYLRASGLEGLEEKVRAGTPCEDSFTAVSGFTFSAGKRRTDGRILLGDASGMIPPFTGNGMSLAMESAEAVLPHVLAYSRDSLTWGQASRLASRDLSKRFRWRRRAALLVQTLLGNRGAQALLASLASRNLLPFERLYSCTR